MRQQPYTISVKRFQWFSNHCLWFTKKASMECFNNFRECFQMKNMFLVSLQWKCSVCVLLWKWPLLDVQHVVAESPKTNCNPSLASSGEPVCKWPGTELKESTVVQPWPIIKSVACRVEVFLLIFAKAVIMVDCGLAAHGVGLLIHPGTWHLLDWWPNYQGGVYCASVIYNVSCWGGGRRTFHIKAKLDFA